MGELEVLDARLAEMESETLEELARLLDKDESKYKLASVAGARRLLKRLREEEIPQLIRKRTRE